MKVLRVAVIVGLLTAIHSPLGAAKQAIEPRIADIFNKQGATGMLVLYDPSTDHFSSNDFARAEQRFPAGRTFYIPLALIALETGAIADESELFPWNGRKYGYFGWDRDQTLTSALWYSTDWVFQRVARRIGRARMASWVKKLDYGNADISGDIDSFWFEGRLRISAMEQIAFLRRLQEGRLPASAMAQSELWRILLIEETDYHSLRAPACCVTPPASGIEWYVGWAAAGTRKRFFALNMDMSKRQPDRYPPIEITWEALKLLDIRL